MDQKLYRDVPTLYNDAWCLWPCFTYCWRCSIVSEALPCSEYTPTPCGREHETHFVVSVVLHIFFPVLTSRSLLARKSTDSSFRKELYVCQWNPEYSSTVKEEDLDKWTQGFNDLVSLCGTFWILFVVPSSEGWNHVSSAFVISYLARPMNTTYSPAIQT